MFKKVIALILIVMSLFALTIPASLAETRKYASPVTMYVDTANGGPLNVRSAPDSSKNNVIGQYKYGDAVTVTGTAGSGWYMIRCAKGTNNTGYVMAKFLTANKISDEAIAKKEIERQLNNYKAVEHFTVVARPTNPETGWVNFRNNPGTSAGRIAALKNGQKLTVIGETLDWYKAIDSVTGLTGYVMKAYVAKAK